MASWRAEPERLSGSWRAYRQTAPDTAPLFHAAGEATPSQRSGRWHRQGHGYAQYLALEATGAWCELIRYERIRSNARAEEYTRKLWLVHVEETDIADLSTFESYLACGLDPKVAVGAHGAAQQLADDLREAGYRGLVSPSAAFPGGTNLTLFGERYEKVLRTQPELWRNPQPGVRLACQLLAEAAPPAELVLETCFEDMPHEAYRDFLLANGIARTSMPP